MTTGQAHDYAVERFNSHTERFDAVAGAMEAGDASFAAALAELEHLDNPFAHIAPTEYAAPPRRVLAR